MISFSLTLFILLFFNFFCLNKKIVNNNKCNNYCYKPLFNPKLKIKHVIITRFLNHFASFFIKYMEKEDFSINAKRVLNKYLLPALERQKCKDFIWVLMIGNQADLSYYKSYFNFHNSFKTELVYEKDIKNYLRNIINSYDVLITTRIDYDDVIYYDAVNDARKSININKPIFIHGFNKGYIYFESDGKYYDYDSVFGNNGVASQFISLVYFINKVNDTYHIYELGDHSTIKSNFLKKYKSFGINDINYNPCEFDKSIQKFIWIRQKYSGFLIYTKGSRSGLKLINFNSSTIYDKCI